MSSILHSRGEDRDQRDRARRAPRRSLRGVTERLVDVDGVELCVETFGAADHPALLLIAGAAASMDHWDVAFCELLAAEGRYVVRYDHRDTGRSSAWPAGRPGYTSGDLTADALRVLDALGVAQAHLVGVSMGGGIAQDVAARHPDRVLSLTLIATSPAGERTDRTPLPPPDPRIAVTPPDPDWADRDAVVAHLVDTYRPYA
jgi:pimeloyl-ACP methyl ester carboxylesterase